MEDTTTISYIFCLKYYIFMYVKITLISFYNLVSTSRMKKLHNFINFTNFKILLNLFVFEQFNFIKILINFLFFN